MPKSKKTTLSPAPAGPAYRRARAEAITAAVGALHGFTAAELRAKGSDQPRATVRQLAMWAHAEITGDGLKTVGEHYGRNQSAALYALRGVELREDAEGIEAKRAAKDAARAAVAKLGA